MGHSRRRGPAPARPDLPGAQRRDRCPSGPTSTGRIPVSRSRSCAARPGPSASCSAPPPAPCSPPRVPSRWSAGASRCPPPRPTRCGSSWRVVTTAMSWRDAASLAPPDRGRRRRSRPLVNEACRLAEEDSELTRAADLSARLGVTPRSLERLVRAHTGMTPKWLIECRRLQHAATTLFTSPGTDLSVLAADLGYTDYPHFSRQYRRAVGESPRMTRERGRASPSRPPRSRRPAHHARSGLLGGNGPRKCGPRAGRAGSRSHAGIRRR